MRFAAGDIGLDGHLAQRNFQWRIDAEHRVEPERHFCGKRTPLGPLGIDKMSYSLECFIGTRNVANTDATRR